MAFYACVLFVVFLAAEANCLGDSKVDGKTNTLKEYGTQPTIGSTADPVISLLTKRQVAGDSSDLVASHKSENEDLSTSGSEHYSTSVNTGFTVGLQTEPHLEILKLVETFIKLKGEVVSKVYMIINDNRHLLKSIINFAVEKISNLHTFTLNGIVILRRVLQFAVDLFGHWGLPSLTVALNKPITADLYTPTHLAEHTNNYHAEGYYGSDFY